MKVKKAIIPAAGLGQDSFLRLRQCPRKCYLSLISQRFNILLKKRLNQGLKILLSSLEKEKGQSKIILIIPLNSNNNLSKRRNSNC